MKPYAFADLRTKNIYDIPALPLPALEDTLSRYLQTVSPLLTETQLQNTTALTSQFLKEHGPDLHSAVAQLAENPERYPHSYIEGFWTEMYLSTRAPLMIHTNPFYVLKNEENPADMEQVSRAAKVVLSSVRWWQKVKSGRMEPDMDRDSPMCMSQFGVNFGLARIPGEFVDTTHMHEESRHVLVICNSRYFKLDVIGKDGKALPQKTLEDGLRKIQEMAGQTSKEENEASDVGILTAGDRTAYFHARKELEAFSEENKKAFAVADECLFVVVLEDDDSVELKDTSPCMLTGKKGTGRWFDKHQVIVNKAGVLGVNFEHSSADGLTWNRWLHEAWHDMHGTSSGFSHLPQEGQEGDNVEGATIQPIQVMM